MVNYYARLGSYYYYHFVFVSVRSFGIMPNYFFIISLFLVYMYTPIRTRIYVPDRGKTVVWDCPRLFLQTQNIVILVFARLALQKALATA